jgi:uncharacterized membrane protein
MRYEWGKKIVNFLHFIIVWYKRIFIILLAILFGTALLSIYSLIDIVKNAAAIVGNNVNTITIILLVLVLIPTVSYIVEKSLTAYIEHK